jgi:small-conductance mechanosensitive channel
MEPWGPWVTHPAFLLGLVVVAALGSAFLVGLAGKLGGRWATAKGTPRSKRIARRLSAPLAVIAGIAAALFAFGRVEAWLDPAVALPARRAVVVLAALAGAWAFVRLVRLLLEGVSSGREFLEPAARAGSRLIGVIVYVIALLAILAAYGISITPLLAGLGIGALAVALALQDTMANFFAGLWIQTERPLAPGHYVRIEGQNVEGFVEEVGWRTTRIRALAGNLIVLPNSRIAQATVTDFTMPEPTMSVVMQFRFPFDVEPQRAMAMLVEEAKAAAKVTPGLLEDPAPFANSTPGIGDSSIGYSLILKVREFVDQWNAQTAVTQRVWARMQREGIRFPYPTRVNLQSDGSDFAPSPVVRPARRPTKAPEGRDPREIEAEQAKQDIAAKQAAQGNSRKPDPAPAPQPAPAPPPTPAPPGKPPAP